MDVNLPTLQHWMLNYEGCINTLRHILYTLSHRHATVRHFPKGAVIPATKYLKLERNIDALSAILLGNSGSFLLRGGEPEKITPKSRMSTKVKLNQWCPKFKEVTETMLWSI